MAENTVIGGIVAGIVAVGTVVGKLSFVTKRDFKHRQSECQKNLGEKIDELNNNVHDLYEENKDMREKQSDAMNRIERHMGKVEQFILDKKDG